MDKLVARFNDGRIVKGMTTDISLEKDTVHVSPFPPSDSWERTRLSVWDLKALFFVKTFEGDPAHVDCHDFVEPTAAAERRVEVTFRDGEIMTGTTPSYHNAGWGFLLTPSDADSNNQRAWIVRSATSEVRYV